MIRILRARVGCEYGLDYGKETTEGAMALIVKKLSFWNRS